jgi:hypothetical protein
VETKSEHKQHGMEALPPHEERKRRRREKGAEKISKLGRFVEGSALVPPGAGAVFSSNGGECAGVHELLGNLDQMSHFSPHD